MDPCLQLLVPANVLLIIVHKSLKRSAGMLRGAIAPIPVTVGRGVVKNILLGGGPCLHLSLGRDWSKSSLHSLCLDVLVLQVACVLVLVR